MRPLSRRRMGPALHSLVVTTGSCGNHAASRTGDQTRSTTAGALLCSVLLVIATFAVAADEAKADKERQEIRKRTKEILAQLYKAQPSAKANVQKAAGYAV